MSLPMSAQKFREDAWSSNPPQVTSYIAYTPRTSSLSIPMEIYPIPICGFGWTFEASEESHYPKSSRIRPPVKGLVRRVVVLSFLPHKCSSMSLNNVKISLKVYQPDFQDPCFTHGKEFPSVAIGSGAKYDLGKYLKPPQYKGETRVEFTITFDPSDGLSLPDSHPRNANKAFRYSLDAPTFADTKFYLYSTRVNGQPACPKVLFARAELLTSKSTFLEELLDKKSSFLRATPCDLLEDVPEEVAKLRADAFDYDSDSDLEDDVKTSHKGKETEPGPSPFSEAGLDASPGSVSAIKPIAGPPGGQALAINNTAYKTWKAFLYYSYTNNVSFNTLRSQQGKLHQDPKDPDAPSCSPKSMYRFADYANIPALKLLAKEAIRRGLSKYNIIAELFSSFTDRYKEIVELEVEFLLANSTPDVARQLDEMLQMVVLGTKPHSFRVLAFTMRRLRGDSTEVAWAALDPINNPAMNPQKSPVSNVITAPATNVQGALCENKLDEQSPQDEHLPPVSSIFNTGLSTWAADSLDIPPEQSLSPDRGFAPDQFATGDDDLDGSRVVESLGCIPGSREESVRDSGHTT